MISVRKAKERGKTDIGWLKSYHTFSFGEYHDPAHMGFRQLRVINDDRVVAGQGFGAHPHRDMEIISYVLEGSLEHKDSMGTGSIIKAGDVQVMSAGSGVTHSEFNPSRKEGVHFLQIWILPKEKNIKPSYQQRSFPADQRRDRLCLIVSSDGRDGSLKIHQDAEVFACVLQDKQKMEYTFRPGQYGWIHGVRGKVSLGKLSLSEGDSVAISQEPAVSLSVIGEAEVLLFVLP